MSDMSNVSDIFNITQCNLAQIIAESNRFVFQITLVHIVTCIIEGKEDIFNETLFKTLLITSLAIIMYHIFFRKMVEPRLEKMKNICGVDESHNKNTYDKYNKEYLDLELKQLSYSNYFDQKIYESEEKSKEKTICERYKNREKNRRGYSRRRDVV
jgi:uncharacterized lipoprotein YehR (DUF1307 family)